MSIATKQRDADHPHGHGKVEFISAGIEGGMIFLAGGAILYKGVVSLIRPEPIDQLDVGIILVAVAGLANFVVGKICVLQGEKNNSLALVSSGKHLQSDAYSSLAILVGLRLLYLTQQQWIDSLVSIAFSFFILFTGYTIIKRSIAGIMDGADEAQLQKLVHLLQANRKENWVDLHVRIIKYGNRLHLDCHLTVPWYLNVHEAYQEINVLGMIVRKEFRDSLELFVHSDGCLVF